MLPAWTRGVLLGGWLPAGQAAGLPERSHSLNVDERDPLPSRTQPVAAAWRPLLTTANLAPETCV